MTHYAIATDLNRCMGCLACSVACKAMNNVPVGDYWNKTLRVGPNPKADGCGTWPDVEMYFLPVQCQHCENPECVKVCPTEASHVAEDGTIQIDKDKCIGCQYCLYGCPYGVRQMDEEHGVAQKCTLCSQITADGSDVPACVHNCNCGARFFGDYDDPDSDVCREMAKYSQDCIHALPDLGNAKPLTRYILSPKFASWKELI